MKKNIFVLLLITMIACDDGDLAIETVDFDSITLVQSCNDVSPTLANLLFKINATEALILELPALAIQNEVGTDVEFNVSASGSTRITYRIFSATVTNAYFCDDIPPTEPVVINEVIAEAGSVFITTVLDADSDDSRNTDLSINEFGVVTTN